MGVVPGIALAVPWESSLGSSPLSPGCLRVAAIGSSFPVSRLGSGGRRRLCLPCRSRGLNHLRGLSASQAARCWPWVTGRAINRSWGCGLTRRVPCRHRCVNTHCSSGEDEETPDWCQSSVGFAAEPWYRLFPVPAAGRRPGLVLAAWEGVSHAKQLLLLVPSARK